MLGVPSQTPLIRPGLHMLNLDGLVRGLQQPGEQLLGELLCFSQTATTSPGNNAAEPRATCQGNSDAWSQLGAAGPGRWMTGARTLSNQSMLGRLKPPGGRSSFMLQYAALSFPYR